MSYTEDNIDPDKDVSLDRKLVLENNVLHICRLDPFGFWYCKYERGGLPEELSGAYTSYENAAKAAKAYLKQLKKVIKEEVNG